MHLAVEKTFGTTEKCCEFHGRVMEQKASMLEEPNIEENGRLMAFNTESNTFELFGYEEMPGLEKNDYPRKITR